MDDKIEVKCKICGRFTSNTGTCLCDRCWQVDNNIGRILSTVTGRRYIQNKLRKAKAEK